LWCKWFQHPQDISARIFSKYRGRNFGGLKVIRNRGESIGRKGERDGEERKGEGKE
jgi:hypothetical protein